MKKLLLFAIVATIFSCSKENHENPSGVEGKTVKITLKTGGTKSVEEGVEDDYTTKISDFIVYFCSKDGNVLKSETVTTVTNESYLFTKVPVITEQVYFVANSTASGVVLTGTNIDAIQSNVISASALNQGVDKSIVEGLCTTLTPAPSGLSNEFVATIYAIPINTRLEIAKFTCGNIGGASTPASNDVVSYTLDEIYVSEYYESTDLGCFTLGNRTLKAAWAASVLCDKGINISSLNNVVIPATGTKPVWAYQFAAEGATPPSAVIKLKDVRFGSGDLAVGPLYLTVKGFSISGTTQSRFERGICYKVENLQFTAENLTSNPYEAAKQVKVEVTVQPWSVQPVNVEL